MLKEGRKPFGRKPVVAIAPNGDVIAYFESMTDASKNSGISVSNICQGVRKGHFRRKLKWMYESDYREYWMTGRTEELAYNRRKQRNEHIREALLNLSPESKERRSKKISEYAKRCYAENTGHNLRKWQEKRRRRIRCIDTGEEFESINEFCKKYGACSGNAWACLNRRRDKVVGLKIEYIKY